MKIQIVNYEEQYGINGILSKYAYSLCRELKEMGHEAVVKTRLSQFADVNHHINYLAYLGPTDAIDTLMVTHLTGDNNQSREFKMDHLRRSLETAYGITMSPVLRERLIQDGLPADRLFASTHAHDSIPRRPMVVAILTNIYPDGRKREEMYLELFKAIDPEKFIFLVMGSGWENILSPIRFKININYFWVFDVAQYEEILFRADYVLYVGDEDCASQSLIDAKQAGIRTIFPDTETNREFGIDHPFTTIEDLITIFKKLEENPVEGLTWRAYTESHVKIWEQLCSR